MIGRHFFCVILLIINFAVNLANAGLFDKRLIAEPNPCESIKVCGKCIQIPACAWCLQQNYHETRCFEAKTSNITCSEEYIWNPDNLQQIIEAKELSKPPLKDFNSSTIPGFNPAEPSVGDGETVQIFPQKMKLKLRPGESFSIFMNFTQAEDYPIDLYYLMDLSKISDDDKNRLSSLGHLLVKSISKITTDFRLGFGFFSNKITTEADLNECRDCAKPHGFQNSMSLSRDVSKFSKMLNATTAFANMGTPKAGLDAIMQAVVCRREIGWRHKAKRILVFSTATGFDYVEEELIIGTNSNDGLCHLNQHGLYTKSDQSSPSINQINRTLQQQAINMIFATTDQHLGLYKKLQSHIEGAWIGLISDDSIVELIRTHYQMMSSTVEIRSNATSPLKINYYSHCKNTDGVYEKTNRCENIKVGDVVAFKMEIKVKSCPRNPKNWLQTVLFYPIGDRSSLSVDLEMLCSCPCEQPGHLGFIQNAEQCSFAGTYKCGFCECDSSHFGKSCECLNGSSFCRPDNSSTACSGRGNCVCGQCECFLRNNEEELIYGNHCECDNFSCDRNKGEICSGYSHGTCDCGMCQCREPWGGPDCSCRMSNETCIAPFANKGEICSGHGECQCGSCKCEATEQHFGKYCEKCSTCPDRCEEFKHCIQCQMYRTGLYNDDTCSKNCTKFTPIGVEKIRLVADKEKGETLCTFYDENNCRFAYVYYYDKYNKLMVRAQANRECISN